MTGKHHRPPKAVADLRRALELGGADEHTEAAVLDAVKDDLLDAQYPSRPDHRVIVPATGTSANHTENSQAGDITVAGDINQPSSRAWELALAAGVTVILVGVVTALVFQWSAHWPLTVMGAIGALLHLERLVRDYLGHRSRSDSFSAYPRRKRSRPWR